MQVSGSWLPREVRSSRTPGGLTTLTVREENQAELVIASKGRSGGHWDEWRAAWAPVGPDGYRKQLWHKETAHIDRAGGGDAAVGYDLRDYVRAELKDVRPQLIGKPHIAGGDMDNHFLNLGVYRVETFLETTKEEGGGVTTRGRPSMRGRSSRMGWQS